MGKLGGICIVCVDWNRCMDLNVVGWFIGMR